ncbi:MAG: proton-conducting transporter membrane subunit, partial [Elusimicrobia bacterium]|nr:proton-conducting transporter membrane subunit [Elusimicrobiota bacterium]
MFLPLAAAIMVALWGGKIKGLKELLSIGISLICLVAGIKLFGLNAIYQSAWAGFGFDFVLRVYPFSSFILCSTAAFALLTSVYSSVFMKGKEHGKWIYFNHLLTLGFASGAVLADNLVLLLFFWEGLLVSLYGFIALAKDEHSSRATAMKALIINGVADLCLILGAAIASYLSATMSISAMHISIQGWGSAAFILMSIGAIAKAGSMPFHSWIPDAATDAQVTFMAFMPAALEKLLGIYLLSRICLDIFNINSSPEMKILLMSVGAITILLAVMMALAQSDYKKLLSYHAISQVGYMILGIGTGTAVGIAGGIFHMINNGVYKSCLFFTAGSVERETKTTDMYKLGGLAKNMPVTAICFIIAAVSISGMPPFNGFFSKELIYDGALQSGYIVFFLAAEIGTFLTAASFLKLGHSVFFGHRPQELAHAKESPWPMLLPMIALAAACVAFGFGAKLPLIHLIAPSLENTFAAMQEPLWGFHFNGLFFITSGVLGLALINHFYGVKKSGAPQKSAYHITNSRLLKNTYSAAAKGKFDPYTYGMGFVSELGKGLFVFDRAMDFITDTLPCAITTFASSIASKLHNGLYSHYLAWTLLGLAVF